MAGNVPAVRERYGYTTSDFGTMLTAGFWVYAVSSPVTGRLSDRIGGRRAVIAATLVCAMVNLTIGAAVELSDTPPHRGVLIALYALNMLAQVRAAPLLPQPVNRLPIPRLSATGPGELPAWDVTDYSACVPSDVTGSWHEQHR